jgi:hypothetical protein
MLGFYVIIGLWILAIYVVTEEYNEDDAEN